jgi:hypothetical protein
MKELHSAFNLPQYKVLGASAAQPEILNGLVFPMKAKKSTAIQAHQGLGALRIGAF